MPPSGFSARQDEKDVERLAVINEIRERVIIPLVALKKGLRSGTGADSAKAIYKYIEDIGLKSTLERMCEGFDKIDDALKIRDLSSQYELSISLIDQLYITLGGVKITPLRFLKLFKCVVDMIDFGSIPRTLDEVEIGSADMMRIGAKKAIFIMGLNEGVFPSSNTTPLLLSSAERNRLTPYGIDITDNDDYSRELYYLYSALSNCEGSVYLSYSEHDGAGSPLYPGIAIHMVQDLFSELVVNKSCNQTCIDLISNERSALKCFASSYKENPELSADIKQALCSNEKYESRISLLERSFKKQQFEIHDKDILDKLFAGDIRLSATKLEKYFSCHFSYFCRYVLGISALKTAELSPINAGSIIHYVLEHLLMIRGIDGFKSASESDIKDIIEKIIKKYLEQYFSGYDENDARMKHQLARLRKMLIQFAIHIQKELLQSEFVPIDFEMIIKPTEDVEPLEIELADGTHAYIEGAIDRVDVMEKGGKKYIRIVDYKSGKKELKLSDVFYGLNIQMLIYLFSIWEKGQGKYDGIVPAGVLYMPVKSAVANLERGASDEKLEQEHMKTYCMNGLILDDADVIKGMEREAKGVFIPTGLKGDTPTRPQSLVTLSELGKIKEHIEKLILEMASGLKSGDISASPIVSKTSNPCGYCEYITICRVSETDIREQSKMNKFEFFDCISKGDIDG